MTDWKALQQRLFGGGEAVHMLVDGASAPDFRQQAHVHTPEFLCLFRGELKDDMAEVAPYIVKLDPDGPFSEWVLRRGWGNHWGTFVLGGGDLDSLRRHFRNFLIVHDETGKPMRFRFYDPRVLATFLPTCTPEEITQFFGPVQQFLLEGPKPSELIGFSQQTGKLKQERVSLPQIPG